MKWNLWGNDSGPAAFALLPYVKLPVDTSVTNGGEVPATFRVVIMYKAKHTLAANASTLAH